MKRSRHLWEESLQARRLRITALGWDNGIPSATGNVSLIMKGQFTDGGVEMKWVAAHHVS